jgi:hypothetical protein
LKGSGTLESVIAVIEFDEEEFLKRRYPIKDCIERGRKITNRIPFWMIEKYV